MTLFLIKHQSHLTCRLCSGQSTGQELGQNSKRKKDN
jgi:hypothetical protein